MPRRVMSDYFDFDERRLIRSRRRGRGAAILKFIWNTKDDTKFNLYLNWYRIAKQDGFPSFYSNNPSKRSDYLTTFDYLLNAIAGRDPYQEFQRGETAR